MPQTVRQTTVKSAQMPDTRRKNVSGNRNENFFTVAENKKSTTSTVRRKRKYTDDKINELAKKYEKNPIALLEQLGINFTNEQKETIKKYLSDKKSIISFLKLVQNESLTKEDIVAGINKLLEMETSSIGTRILNVFKTAFDDGLTEAIKLAQSERIYKSEKLSENMGEIRDEREDFSSDSVANIADTMVKKPKIKKEINHFVTKKNSQGVHLYDEASTNQAVKYMRNNSGKAAAYTANAAELEAITDNNKQTKYKGSTIVNVAGRMTDAPELKKTMMAVGCKQDMNDENFDAITKNVFDNPNMSDTIHYMATCKDENNNDKFSTNNIRNSSEYLVNKNAEVCQNYNSTIKELSLEKGLNGTQITELTELTSKYPEYKDEILNTIKHSNLSGNELVEKCKNIVNNDIKSAPNNSSQEITSNNEINQNSKNELNNPNQQRDEQADITESEKITIDGEEYNRNEVLKHLEKQYGADGEKILQNLEKPEFISYMKEYSNNKNIMKQLVANPQECVGIIKKLKNASSTISANEMAELLDLCQSGKTTEMLIAQVEKQGVTSAISNVRKAKLEGKLEDAKKIFEQTTLRKDEQKEKFEQLINGKYNSTVLYG